MPAGEISDFNVFIYVKRSIRTRSTETAMLNTVSSSQKLMFSILVQCIVCSINHKKMITVVSHKCEALCLRLAKCTEQALTVPAALHRQRDASVTLHPIPRAGQHSAGLGNFKPGQLKINLSSEFIWDYYHWEEFHVVSQ